MGTDRKQLRELAEKATPGPWEGELDKFDDDDGIVATVADFGVWPGLLAQVLLDGREETEWPRARESQGLKDARFMAAADPQTVIALLDDVDKLKQQRDALREAFDAALIECDTENAGADQVEAWRALIRETKQ